MRILELITSHRHYWGVPHRRATDDRLIMTCYECSREREVLAPLRPAAEGAASDGSNGRGNDRIAA